MTKVTYTLDNATVSAIRRSSKRENKPQSLVVREAIAAYVPAANRLSDAERRHLLHVLDTQSATRPKGSAAAVDRQLRDLRESRRGGGRRR